MVELIDFISDVTVHGIQLNGRNKDVKIYAVYLGGLSEDVQLFFFPVKDLRHASSVETVSGHR